MNLQRVGGVASVVNAFLWAFFMFILIVLFPRIGLVDPNDWRDAAKGIAAWSASPVTFSLLNLDFIPMSIATLLTILGIRQRLQTDAQALMSIAVIAGSVFSALWLAGALTDWGARASIVAAQDLSAYLSIQNSIQGLCAAAAHSLGWALLLSGWAALKSRKLPRIPICLAMVGGLFFLFEFVVGLFGFIGSAFFVVASFWLGIALLKNTKEELRS
jgi:hypothetical protein